MAENMTCPVCGNQTNASVLRDEAALRRAIEVLEGRLRDLQSEHPTPEHPAHLYGGYGGEPPPDQPGE